MTPNFIVFAVTLKEISKKSAAFPALLVLSHFKTLLPLQGTSDSLQVLNEYTWTN